jgi:superfamily II DNA or RNA helicase
MAQTGSQDWFKDAAEWFWKGNGDSTQKNAARIYLQAIKYRREFLNNLTSSAVIANKLKDKILNSQITNKVLLFSELTSQAEKLSAYSIHSKQDEETNRQLLYMFDTGTIRELSAVRSLSLGLNLVGANWAIVESFNSSSVDLLQKIGRTSRLNPDAVANIVIIVPLKLRQRNGIKHL